MNLFRLPFNIRLKKLVDNRLAMMLLLSLCVLASLASVARAQEQGEEVLRVESNLVQLNVGVVDQQGRAVTSLARDDFAVYEDGVRQPIQTFEPASAPFSLVLLLDVSGSTMSFRPSLKQAAMRFIDALSPEDRVAVISFNQKVQTLAGFTTDRRKIAYAIDIADGRGETQFYKALNYSLEQLAKEGKRRKAIVVMTDGIDTQMRNADRASAAHAQTNEEAIASIKPDASPQLNSVLNAADRQGVTIFPLALPSGDPKRLPLPDPTITAIYTSARTRLQTLADRTGGNLNEIRRLDELARLYAEVAASLRTLYTIVYKPSSTEAQSGKWHTIRVEVARQPLIAKTKTGYYSH
jgi:VWFA-related protein